MIPKIEFRYSWIYDEGYRNSPKINKVLNEKGKTYPSTKEILSYIDRIELLWAKQGNKILEKISELSNLEWQEQNIRCYVIGFGRPFSDPLTLRLYENKNDFIDTLSHELIHQIQIQNDYKIKKWWAYIDKNYASESRLTKNHTFLHSLHSEIYLKLYNRKRLEKNIRKDKEYPDYWRSWEIAQKEGYKNIINEFRKRIK